MSHHKRREAVMESKMQVDKTRQVKFFLLYASPGITLFLSTSSLLIPAKWWGVPNLVMNTVTHVMFTQVA